MRIAVPHHTTPGRARQIVDKRLKTLEKQYGHKADDFGYEWDGNTLHLSAKAKGLSLKGTLEITADEVIVDGKLPLLAKPFEGRIRQTVEMEAESMFRKA